MEGTQTNSGPTPFELYLERARSGIAANADSPGPPTSSQTLEQGASNGQHAVGKAATRSRPASKASRDGGSFCTPSSSGKRGAAGNHVGSQSAQRRVKDANLGSHAPKTAESNLLAANAVKATGKGAPDESTPALVSQASLRHPVKKHHIAAMYRTSSGPAVADVAPSAAPLAPEASFLIRLDDLPPEKPSKALSIVSEGSRQILGNPQRGTGEARRKGHCPKFPPVPSSLLALHCHASSRSSSLNGSVRSERCNPISHTPSETGSVFSVSLSTLGAACGAHMVAKAASSANGLGMDQPAAESLGERRNTVDQALQAGTAGHSGDCQENTGEHKDILAHLLLTQDATAVQKAIERAALLSRFNAKELVTASEVAADAQAVQYNEALTLLRDRLYTKGWRALDYFFKTIDKDGVGTLPAVAFRNALLQLNIGTALDGAISDQLVRAAECQRQGEVNYRAFVEALRVGKITYSAISPKVHHRVLPDPARPLGGYLPLRSQPFGVLDDADANLAAFQSKLSTAYEELQATFMRIDSSNSGLIDRAEFTAALEEISRKKNLNISGTDVSDILRQAQLNVDQTLSWRDFMDTFGKGEHFIPEFLRPKCLRCSQTGSPWAWMCMAPPKPRPRIHGYSEWLTADSVVLG